MPPEQTHFESLSDLHDLILGWVTRNDAELAEERLKRADRSSWDKKRAKSKNQERWDIEREQAEKEWREGFGTFPHLFLRFRVLIRGDEIFNTRLLDLGSFPVIPDLTLPENVSQCRHWIEALDADPAFLPRIRFIRLWEGNREEFRVEQEGIAGPGQKDGDGPGDRSKGGDDGTMEVDVSQMKEGKESVDWNKRRDSMMGMDDAPPPAVSGTPALVAAAAP